MEVINLKAFLANKCLTVKEFAKILDVEPQYLSAVANGKKTPGRKLARDIEKATNGVIKLTPKPKKSEKKQEDSQ